MKNVLFATTALVAMAGSAMAASHGLVDPISFSGELVAGYNDEVENGIYWTGELNLGASVDMGDNVTATLDVTVVDWANGFSGATSNATVEIAYTGGAMSASLKAGDLGDKGASEYFYSDRDGMSVDIENQDATSDVRALIEFGSIGVAVGCQVSSFAGTPANVAVAAGVDPVTGVAFPAVAAAAAVPGTAGECLGANVGVGATFGSISVGIGYDDNGNGQTEATAVSADAAFGAMSVGVSYITTAAQDSTGIAIGYDVSNALNVGVYYADNSVAGEAYGLSAGYSAGAMTVGVFYDSLAGGAEEYGMDVSYAVSDAISLNAGYKSGTAAIVGGSLLDDHYYVGMDYAVNDAISATVSYSTANEDLGSPEYKQGISAFITATF